MITVSYICEVQRVPIDRSLSPPPPTHPLKNLCGIYILHTSVPCTCISAEMVSVTPLPGAVSVTVCEMLEVVMVVATVCEPLLVVGPGAVAVTVCERLEAVIVVAVVCEPQGAKVVTVAVEEPMSGATVTVTTLETLGAEVIVTVVWESV